MHGTPRRGYKLCAGGRARPSTQATTTRKARAQNIPHTRPRHTLHNAWHKHWRKRQGAMQAPSTSQTARTDRSARQQHLQGSQAHRMRASALAYPELCARNPAHKYAPGLTQSETADSCAASACQLTHAADS